MRRLLALTVLTILCACGREGAPFPPEAVSPKGVDNIQTQVADKQLTINWIAPTTNLRGKKLTEITGYKVYRASLPSDLTIEKLQSDDFSQIATIPDSTMQALEKKRALAKQQGKPESRVKLDQKERVVTFTDKSVVLGKTYVYKIVPYNHRWVDGAVPQLVKVAFKGANSEVAVLDNLIGLQAIEESTEFIQTE